MLGDPTDSTSISSAERRAANRNSQIYEASGANRLMESELLRLRGESAAIYSCFKLPLDKMPSDADQWADACISQRTTKTTRLLMPTPN